MSVLRRLADGLTNVITGLGTNADARRGRAYAPRIITEAEVSAAYSGSAMLRKAIRIPALDMTREWRDWQADADQIEALEAEERRLSMQSKVLQAEVLRGLGGGALILGLPGDPSTPIGTTGKGALAYVHVVSRWQLGLGQQVMDPRDPLFGGPQHFTLSTTGGPIKLHPSRVVAFRGEPLPLHTAVQGDDWFWGEGRVGTLIEPAMNLDEALASFAALIKDARNIDIGVPRLMDMMTTADGEQTLTRRLQLMVQGQSVIRATVFDAGDKEGKGGETINRHQVTWTGIPDVIRAYAEALSAASDIPVTRLWGTSAKGLNATGEGDDRDWNKMVGARQTLDLRPCLDQLDAVLIPSALGTRPPELWWKFAPLSIPTQAQEAERFGKVMEATAKLQATGAIPDVAFVKGVQNLMSEEGWMPGLDAALAELPEDERFGLVAGEPDDSDPSALQAANENDPAEPRARAANDRRFTDAAPRTLYVQRKLLNGADLIRWAKAQGFETTTAADDLHVTIAYSRQPLDWMQIGPDWSGDASGNLTVPAGGPRLVEPLGDKGAVVLLFGSDDLKWRHQRIREAGASFDFDQYQPHVTITYAAPEELDLSKVEPFTGPLKFGPELFSEVVEGWRPEEV